MKKGRAERGGIAGLAAAFAIAALAQFAVVPAAFTQPTPPALWLGKLTELTEAKFVNLGVAIQAVDCPVGEVACVTAEIDAAAAGGPRVLVAPAAYTATVIELYGNGLTQEKVQGVVLLGPPADEISIPSVSAGASSLLVLIEETEEPKEILKASLLTRAMAAQGVFARLRFVDQGMLSPDAIHTGTVLSVLHFMGGDFGGGNPDVEILKLLFDAEFTWPTLPPNNRKLREKAEIVSTRPMHDAVKKMLAFHDRDESHMIHQWPMATYDSFDLLAYRDRTAPGARYVILRNRMGMVFVLDLEVFGAYKPEIVVGIDDEPNMFRVSWFYRTNRMFSWLSERQNTSVRPLGPFLSFRKPLPDDLILPIYPLHVLYLGGIEFSNENPFEAISAYSDTVRRVITKDNKCIYCHQIEGMGGTAYHLDAMTAWPQGGYALPLADYSEEVMRQFVFDQEVAAAKVGVTPNAIEPAVADAFFAWTRTLTPTNSGSSSSQ